MQNLEKELSEYCKNWFAKSGKLEDVELHNLVEGIRQIWLKDKKTENIIRELFKSEYHRRLAELLSHEENIIVPTGKLIGIYQLEDPNYPRLFAIVKQEEMGYAVGAGYDPEKGRWDSGDYCISQELFAHNSIIEHYGEVREIWHI